MPQGESPAAARHPARGLQVSRSKEADSSRECLLLQGLSSQSNEERTASSRRDRIGPLISKMEECVEDRKQPQARAPRELMGTRERRDILLVWVLRVTIRKICPLEA